MKQLFILSASVIFTTVAYSQTFNCGDTLIDSRDGKKYATVLIGSDCWFKQNLNYGTYVESDSLGIIHSQQTNNGIPEKYAQQNDTNNFSIYGGLYEQSELMNYSSGPQGLCPSGWHVSTDQEWDNLITVAGGSMISSTAGAGGNALKAIGEGFGQGVGTDLVGISLRHGGDRDGYGIFYGIGLRAIYWTSTSAGLGQAYHYTLWATNDTIERLALGTTSTGFSCRCVKDNTTGINDNTNEGSINIYPNPFSTQTTLQTDHYLNNATLKVYNFYGQLNSQIKNINGQTIVLQRENLASGLYFVHLIQDKQVIGISKLVITD
ncbi:MAG: FISUMP domain-containing protein [Fluviicola sp.]